MHNSVVWWQGTLKIINNIMHVCIKWGRLYIKQFLEAYAYYIHCYNKTVETLMCICKRHNKYWSLVSISISWSHNNTQQLTCFHHLIRRHISPVFGRYFKLTSKESTVSGRIHATCLPLNSQRPVAKRFSK